MGPGRKVGPGSPSRVGVDGARGVPPAAAPLCPFLRSWGCPSFGQFQGGWVVDYYMKSRHKRPWASPPVGGLLNMCGDVYSGLRVVRELVEPPLPPFLPLLSSFPPFSTTSHSHISLHCLHLLIKKEAGGRPGHPLVCRALLAGPRVPTKLKIP